MNAPVTLYLADDHQIVVDGLKLLISSEENIKIVGSSNDGDTACREIMAKKPDIALIDLRMPGMTGLELIYKLTRIIPNTRFIILSMHGNPRDIRDAMNGGAVGYLLKNTGRADLINCLSAVINGEKHFPNLTKNKVLANKPVFTPREFEILKLVLEEFTTAQIADQLFLSPFTVETHRKNIGRKANTSTSIGLIKFLQDNHIEL
jgi:DNA-binding NarL/FixJ family response regulator